ncbi:hypothetical protein ATKI12_3621 [Kitasatospora sp. Ki12]
MTCAEAVTAVRACAQLASGGGGDVIASQALRYVDRTTWDAPTARGLQAAGIFICFTDGGAMGDCACLRDLLVNEGKAQFDNLLQGALHNWSEPPARMRDAAVVPVPR